MEVLQILEAPFWLTASSKPWKQAGPGTVHGPAAGRKGAGGVVPGLVFVKREKVEGHSDGSAYNTCFDSTHFGNSIVKFPGRDICQTITFSLIPPDTAERQGANHHGKRGQACVRGRRLRQGGRHVAVPDMPEAGNGQLLLQQRLLQAQLGM